MKKVLALILVMLMVFSMSITAFADGETTYEVGEGSVTISNATVDQTYKIYKFFDATYKTDASNKVEAVSYTIAEDDQFFALLFGADGKTENQFFIFTPVTTEPKLEGTVTKRAAANDSELVDYLAGIIKAEENNIKMAADAVTATQPEIVFDNIPYGYYMIFSTLGTTVTVTSNTPDITVIDKNQIPGDGFVKLIKNGEDAEGNPIWAERNTAAIGDVVTYKISFEATNYYKTEPVKYYQVHDTKGDGIWADFNSIQVKVGGTNLERGYFISLTGGTLKNNFIGNWDGVDTTAEGAYNNAQWYLVLTGDNTYRFTIPWMNGHSLTIDSNTKMPALAFENNAVSEHASPVTVEITYDATVLPTAVEGLGLTNMTNKANATWTTANYAPSSVESSVYTDTFGLGLLKEDGSTRENLAGAEFRIYSDTDCTKPVYIIPTDIEGVYIVDSLGKASENVEQSRDAREVYENYLAGYLKEGKTQDNYMITPINGKVIVRGLDAGTYYLRETKAPDGYNPLSTTIEMKVDVASNPFQVFVDETGKVGNVTDEVDGYSVKNFHVVNTSVQNSKGTQLPSTGGEGAMMLIALGTVLATAFAVLLITQKKMSIYKD